MGMEQIFSLMGMCIKGSSSSGNLMALDSISGAMIASTLVISRMVSNMVRVNGERIITPIATNTTESTIWTKSMVMVSLAGKVVMSTRAITKKMREMAMERCIGLTALSIRESGERVFNMAMGYSLLLKVLYLRDISIIMCTRASYLYKSQ
jgi:hypothetical protein